MKYPGGDARIVASWQGVSALAGETDRLPESCRQINGQASASAIATVVAGGEMHGVSPLTGRTPLFIIVAGKPPFHSGAFL
jgi:hypothetical protein